MPKSKVDIKRGQKKVSLPRPKTHKGKRVATKKRG